MTIKQLNPQSNNSQAVNGLPKKAGPAMYATPANAAEEIIRIALVSTDLKGSAPRRVTHPLRAKRKKVLHTSPEHLEGSD